MSHVTPRGDGPASGCEGVSVDLRGCGSAVDYSNKLACWNPVSYSSAGGGSSWSRSSALYGWGTRKKATGGFHRVRYQGGPLHMQKALHVSRADGGAVTFTETSEVPR